METETSARNGSQTQGRPPTAHREHLSDREKVARGLLVIQPAPRDVNTSLRIGIEALQAQGYALDVDLREIDT